MTSRKFPTIMLILSIGAIGMATFQRPPAVVKMPESSTLEYTAWNLVDQMAHTWGVQPELVRGVITVESGWNPSARSSANALGLMQVLPSTARWMGVDPGDLFIPRKNLRAGCAYLRYLSAKYGDTEKVLMAYNCGPGATHLWPTVGRRYAEKVRLAMEN